MRCISTLFLALVAVGVLALSGCADKPICAAYKACCKLVEGQGKDVSYCAGSLPSEEKACSSMMPTLMYKVRKAGGTQLHGMCKKMWSEALHKRKK